MKTRTKFTSRQITVIGFFSALSYVLMLLHLPFKYMGFLEFEFSDVPAVIAALAYGPQIGIFIELVKNLIKALTASTTGCVGEAANFIINSCFILPLGLVYKLNIKNKTLLSFICGNIGYIIAGIVVNYFVTVPLYAKLFGGMDAVIGAANAVIPSIHSLSGVVVAGITPFNILKGIIISVVGYYCFKFLRKIVQAREVL